MADIEPGARGVLQVRSRLIGSGERRDGICGIAKNRRGGVRLGRHAAQNGACAILLVGPRHHGAQEYQERQ